MTEVLDASWPTWLRDIDSLLAVHPHFVVEGNVRDWFSLPTGRVVRTVSEAVATGLAPSGFDVVLVHDVVDGFSVLGDDQEAAWAAVQSVVGRDLRGVAGGDLGAVAEVLRALARGEGRPVAFVLEMADRLAARPNDLDPPERELFRVATKVSQAARRGAVSDAARIVFNPVLWVVEDHSSLPPWFVVRNPGVRAVVVPQPDLAAREDLARVMLTSIEDEEERTARAREVAGLTDGLGTRSIADLMVLFFDLGIDPSAAADAVRTYKVGAAESPWQEGAVAERLRGDGDRPPAHKMLSARVLGQERAVTKSVDIVTRAVLGLSGAQASRSPNRPRGVLFLVGPTGTGKTELAKSITELVFGNPDAYVRFDMSEFASEHAGDRLIGAPPGYVGFNAGGELTNAVRRRPHSLLLFDEIEKAHPLILDKFLQVLEDGRLTDGQGSTVHFSETLIVFTSNIGTYRQLEDGSRVPSVDPRQPYEKTEKTIRQAVKDHFSVELNRPELLNRIGDNIVVFDFISDDVAEAILDLQVGNVLRAVEASVGVTVHVSPRARATLLAAATDDLWFGGRGIGNVIESRLVNPLARALFERRSGASTFTVEDLALEASGPVVVLR